MISNETQKSLCQMEFGELRSLIDYCLQNTDTIESKHLSFVTHNIEIITQYIDILESKIPNKPIYSPPQFSSLLIEPQVVDKAKKVTAEELKNKCEMLILAKEKDIKRREMGYLQEIRGIEKKLLLEKNKKDEVEKQLKAYENQRACAESNKNQIELFQLKYTEELRSSNKEEKIKLKIKAAKENINRLGRLLKQTKTKLQQIDTQIQALEHSLEARNTRKEQFIKRESKTFAAFVIAQKNKNFEKQAEKINKLAQETFISKVRTEFENEKNKEIKDFNWRLSKYEDFYNDELKIYENSMRVKIIKRMRSEIINFNSSKFSATKLNWKLLPFGEISFSRIYNYLKEISKFSKDEFDFEKIEKIISLKADKVYCGVEEFDGYLVFYFENIKIAVLDCPKKGNAIYVFGEDWKTLSRLTKFELLNYHSHKTERIIHRGDWFLRLKITLRRRSR